ncbi:MAG: DUF1573 domain-containing protein [Thermoanaerobaculia bacterium]|nr:DUF1573 domain-containing protein [Thermoanaerobaculia bacterium]
MRNYSRIFLLFTALIAISPVIKAQKEHLKDIRPLLKSLTPAQKLQVLNYLRHLGADIDDEIQHAYERISYQNQENAVTHIDLLKKGENQWPAAQVAWNRDTIFFPKMPEGNRLIDSFTVRNTGSTPYLIQGTKTTCDCVILKSPDHPVMPGESAVVRVEFDSRGKRGLSTPAIILYDNSIPNKRTILYLRGEIAPRKKLRKNPWED